MKYTYRPSKSNTLLHEIVTALSIILLLILSGVSNTSQAQTIQLKGKVTDNQNGAAMAGASVAIEGTTVGTITDDAGIFFLDSPVDTTNKIVISYVGYKTQTLPWPTSNFQNIKIKLNSSAVEMGEVVINGIAEGQIMALIEMRQADNIKNIVSAEQIQTFPDLNAAEVLQRVPGITLQRDQGEGRFVQLRGTPPELTNFNVDGEQVPSPEGGARYVGLDIIPSDQIEAIEVSKVLTPDMDGDGIGGSVNIRTKTAKEGPPRLSGAVAAGYGALRGTPNYNAQLAYGSKSGKIGFQVNGSYFRNEQGSDNLEYSFVKGPFFNSTDQMAGVNNFNLHYREAQLRHYDIIRERASISSTVDYSFRQNSKIYLRGMFNRFSDEETRRRLVYDLDDPLSASYFLFGGLSHEVRERTKIQNLSTIALGGEHTLGNGILLDYQVFLANAGEDEPDFLEARFDNPGQAIAIQFDNSNPNFPKATFPNPDHLENAIDYENYDLDELAFATSTSSERLLTPRINLTLPYNQGNELNSGYIKFGGKLRSRVKSQDIRSQSFGAYRSTSTLYPGSGAPLNLQTVADDFVDNDLLNEGYQLQAMPSTQKIRDFYEFDLQYFIIDRNETRENSLNQDYQYAEDIWAAYLMARHTVGKLIILGGVRYERTDVTQNDGLSVVTNGSRFIGVDTISSSQTQDFWLPQLQLRYQLNQKINLRAAVSRTYSRPNYSEVVPSREEDRREVSVGNPELNFPVSTNVDLMVERYAGRSIFSVGAFYKSITDFVFAYRRFGREGPPGTGNFPVFELTKPLNGRGAEVFGLEAQYQGKFNFLPGALKNFGAYTNYTFTSSKAFIPKRVAANLADAIILDPNSSELSDFFDNTGEEEISLPGQAKHTANVGLFYDNSKLFVRATVNYQDAFLNEIGSDPDLDEFYDESLRLDVTANYKISKSITVFGDFINLTNEPLRLYLGQPDIVKQQEFYSWWMRVGFRFNL